MNGKIPSYYGELLISARPWMWQWLVRPLNSWRWKLLRIVEIVVRGVEIISITSKVDCYRNIFINYDINNGNSDSDIKNITSYNDINWKLWKWLIVLNLYHKSYQCLMILYKQLFWFLFNIANYINFNSSNNNKNIEVMVMIMIMIVVLVMTGTGGFGGRSSDCCYWK